MAASRRARLAGARTGGWWARTARSAAITAGAAGSAGTSVLGAVGLEVGQVGAIAAAGVGGGVGGRRINRQAQVLLQLVAGQLGRDLRVSPIRLQGASLSETSRWTTSQAIWSATGQRSKATPDPVRQAIAVN
jgi:hypothetical protein